MLVVESLPAVEKQVTTKHVENLSVPRLDEGSTPSSSTKQTADTHISVGRSHYARALITPSALNSRLFDK